MWVPSGPRLSLALNASCCGKPSSPENAQGPVLQPPGKAFYCSSFLAPRCRYPVITSGCEPAAHACCLQGFVPGSLVEALDNDTLKRLVKGYLSLPFSGV